MAKRLILTAWLASLIIAVFVGYKLGKGDAVALKLQEADGLNKNTIQNQSVVVLDKTLHEDSPVSQSKQDFTVTADDALAQYRDKQQRLADTGAAISGKKAVEDERANARDFAENYNDADLDWQAKTNITDFLQLHEDVERIDLQKIICDQRRCQLIGQYAGEHLQWEAILKAMREQDWWDYTGTSSTSQSKNGQTYFNVYLDKPASQNN